MEKTEEETHLSLKISAQQVSDLLRYEVMIPGFYNPVYGGHYEFTFSLNDDPFHELFFNFTFIRKWLKDFTLDKVTKEDLMEFLLVMSVLGKNTGYKNYSLDSKTLTYEILDELILWFEDDAESQSDENDDNPEDDFLEEEPEENDDPRLTDDPKAAVKIVIDNIIRFQKNESLPFNKRNYTLSELKEAYVLLRKNDVYHLNEEEREYGHQLLSSLAERSDPEGTFDMAMEYYGYTDSALSPFLFPRDHENALELYLKAGEKGITLGYTSAGYLYLDRKNDKDHDVKAFNCFAKAASQGDYEARYKLADLYYEGTGVQENKEKARKIIQDNFPKIVDFALNENNPWFLASYASRKASYFYNENKVMKKAYILISLYAYNKRLMQKQEGWNDVKEMQDLQDELKSLSSAKEEKNSFLPYALTQDDLAFLFSEDNPFFDSENLEIRLDEDGKKDMDSILVEFAFLTPFSLLTLVSSSEVKEVKKFLFKITLEKPLEKGLNRGVVFHLLAKEKILYCLSSDEDEIDLKVKGITLVQYESPKEEDLVTPEITNANLEE